jgi:hypothetical protein
MASNQYPQADYNEPLTTDNGIKSLRGKPRRIMLLGSIPFNRSKLRGIRPGEIKAEGLNESHRTFNFVS